jgi:hypothetical protein
MGSSVERSIDVRSVLTTQLRPEHAPEDGNQPILKSALFEIESVPLKVRHIVVRQPDFASGGVHLRLKALDEGLESTGTIGRLI